MGVPRVKTICVFQGQFSDRVLGHHRPCRQLSQPGSWTRDSSSYMRGRSSPHHRWKAQLCQASCSAVLWRGRFVIFRLLQRRVAQQHRRGTWNLRGPAQHLTHPARGGPWSQAGTGRSSAQAQPCSIAGGLIKPPPHPLELVTMPWLYTDSRRMASRLPSWEQA